MSANIYNIQSRNVSTDIIQFQRCIFWRYQEFSTADSHSDVWFVILLFPNCFLSYVIETRYACYWHVIQRKVVALDVFALDDESCIVTRTNFSWKQKTWGRSSMGCFVFMKILSRQPILYRQSTLIIVCLNDWLKFGDLFILSNC